MPFRTFSGDSSPSLADLDANFSDLGSTESGKGSALVGIEDAGGYFAGTNAEAALQEVGAAARWVEDKLAERVTPEDFGAVGDGVTLDDTAFAAMLASGKKNFRLNDGKNYLLSSSLSLSNYTGFLGAGIGRTTITVNANVVPIKVLGSHCIVGGFTLVKGGANTKAGIQNGDASTKCDRTVLRDIYVSGGTGSASDGINCINGNLGSMYNVHGNSNTGWGCRFSRTVGVNDNHGWHIDASCNWNGNTAGGFTFEAGTSVSDGTAPKSHTGRINAQSNTGRGVYVGTSKNDLVVYSESNGSDNCYLDQYASGSRIHMVEGTVVGNLGGVAGSIDGTMVSYANHNANYRAGFKSKVEVSGGVGKGFRVAGDDGTAGYVEIEKKAARDFRITGSGSGGVWNTYFDHSSGTGIQHAVNFGGGLFPMLGASYDIGSSSLVWKDAYLTRVLLGSANRSISSGSGSPEGVLTASPGAIYINTDGGTKTSMYVKESGTGNTGWVGK